MKHYLRALDEPVTSLRGVGPAASAGYLGLGITTYSDLLLLNPRSWEDRSQIHPIGRAGEGEMVNTIVEVLSHSWFGGRSFKKRTLKITVRDISGEGDGRLSLLCFGRNFLEKTIRVGRSYYLWAQVHYNRGERQSSQFEAHPIGDDLSMPPAFGKILPIYPLRGSLSQRLIRTNIESILASVTRFADELPRSIQERHNLLDTDTAIRNYHYPSDRATLERAQRTLAFTELFYLQLATRPTKQAIERTTVPSCPSERELALIDSLPFSLTADQMQSLAEIRADIASDEPMNRLLQGDVGSGKTLVAWITALYSLARGGQVAFMAPTELLARQHAEGAAKLLGPLGVRLAFLTGRRRNSLAHWECASPSSPAV